MLNKSVSMRIESHFNPLAVEFFCQPSRGTEIIFYKPSPGTNFFQCLPFGMDFCLWYSCFSGWEWIEAPPLSTLQGKFVYTFFKAESQEIQFPLLSTKPSKDKFFLSKSRGRFIEQPCLACTISSADLSVNHAN